MIWCNLNAILARAKKLFELTSLYEGKLNKELFEHVKYLLDDATDEKWSAIRRFLHLERMTTLVGFASTLSSFNIYQTIVKKLVAKLEKYVKSIVESKTKEEAGRVLMNMKDRFKTKFSCDSDSMPRLWTRKEDIKAITKTACSVVCHKFAFLLLFFLSCKLICMVNSYFYFKLLFYFYIL
ncbi:Protein ROOT HAIR DEFECTIVE 3 [Dendrobium catenatum]|uniref:Protein ROOT HAIR DEFECTIVE 3 n=1 Tax=Dendrobium catenatum TaxID=906689 RepID=A0A2I0XJC2_9ASPA|nr:Protein ROOT HAIR DEFECTIVE 3 [Dendrobium catenatum]